jgi:integrase
MAVSIQQRKTQAGTSYFTATVRVAPYDSASQTFATKREARDWGREQERELKKQAERNTIRADVPQLSFADLLKEFLEDPETQGLKYFPDLTLLCAWWTGHYGGERIMKVNLRLMLRTATKTLRIGRAPATVNRYLSALRRAWNWGHKAGLVPEDRVWPKEILLTEPKERVRYLIDTELDALIKAAKEHSDMMHAAVLVSLGCGIRKGELLRLKWSDIDLDKQQLRVLITKNGEARGIHLPKNAANALRALKQADVVGHNVLTDEKGQPIDKSSLEYRWRAVRKTAKLDDFRWHDLRHSCASYLAQNGASLLEIGSVLGHKSPSVTMRYAHLVAAKPVTGHAALDQKLKS